MVRLAAPRIQESVTRKLAARKCALSAGAAVALLVLSAFLINCGSSKPTLPPQTPPNIAGEWEFIAVSQNGETTGIEVALAEGQVLSGEIMVPTARFQPVARRSPSFLSLPSLLPTSPGI